MGTLTENYSILKELGRGGMGAVFLATDKRLDRKVAIKILQLNNNFTIEQKSEIITRFQKEARAVAKLSHTNIVGIHDIGEDSSQHYMVMEFLEGRSIGSILEADGILPIEECINISIQMCKALAYIHNNSIVHRDIKPDNIIITKDNVAKLTDFGIAQNDADALRLTQDGAILGSIMYISPEQLRNSKDVDNGADIYSYGVTLYQMLTGQLPFNGETVGEVVAKILSENPELPRKVNTSIPYELEAIVMKAMNKSRDKRYKSIEDMERDLQNLAATHSFKKTTVINKSTNTEINNPANLKNTTIYNNTSANLNTKKAIVIEKASSETKLIRTLIKLVVAVIAIHLSYSLIFNLISSDIATTVASGLNNASIQGPYSQYLVGSKTALQAALYSLLVVLAILGFAAYSFPIESKGIHRNFSIKSEIGPAILVLVFTAIYTLFFVAKVDTLKEYESAYNHDVKSEISNFDELIKQKGALDYSEIDNYKKKYRNMLNKKAIASVYSDIPTQLKEDLLQGDYIKLNIVRANKTEDPTSTIISDLINNVFSFNDPSKELYLNKVNQLLSTVSEGTLTSLPDKAAYKVGRNTSTNKVDSVKFEWEKNNFIIKNGFSELNIDDKNYKYPKASDKVSNLFVENDTDKPVLLLLYSGSNTSKIDNLTVESGKKEEIKIRAGNEYQSVVLFKDKTAIPLSGNQSFNNDDLIKIDKVYYNTNDYYSLNEKSFPNAQEQKLTKVDLKSQDIFFTNDSDIILYNLSAPRKK